MTAMMNDAQLRLLGIYLILINILAVFLYGIDKYRAKRRKWRIPESSLLMSAVFGGAFGAYLGMKLFHHKTKHWYFGVTVTVSLIAWTAIVFWIVYQKGYLF